MARDTQTGFGFAVPLLGAVFGLVWSQLGFAAATRGHIRDVCSVGRVVAAEYEVLVEHTLAGRAGELVDGMVGHNHLYVGSPADERVG